MHQRVKPRSRSLNHPHPSSLTQFTRPTSNVSTNRTVGNGPSNPDRVAVAAFPASVSHLVDQSLYLELHVVFLLFGDS
jgi:hypothetical protein